MTAERDEHLQAASTWPRPWGRGDSAASPGSSAARPGFNVAAAVGPRRFLCFAVLTLGGWLQRGRGRGAAEMATLDGEPFPGATASTWPRPWGRGDWRSCTPPWATASLQRGRGRGAAEIETANSGRDGREASTWPRPWGRGDDKAKYDGIGGADASTWPRPWGRGDDAAEGAGHEGPPGFNVAAAVGPRRCGRVARRRRQVARFNVAAAVGPRRCQDLTRRLDAERASTWPRPWGRGDGGADHRPPAARRASTWPRPWGRGDGAGADDLGGFGCASTWPRPWGRGDWLAVMLRSVVKMLQRGRGRGAAEIRQPVDKDAPAAGFNVAAAVGPRR